jgi:ketose-bisphosphate aldolase
VLATLAAVLDAAGNGAVGSFNILDLEMAAAVVAAAEERQRPVVLGVATRHFEAVRAALLTPAVLRLAEKAAVPVALHLDHASARQQDLVGQALDLGFTSIMIDASHCSLAENTAISRDVVERCRRYGASVEGELGGIAGVEGVADTHGEALEALPYTDPADAERYVDETGVDALAIAVGTAHGIYSAAPEISFATIEQVRRRVPVPLVLHGSTGVRPDDIRRCVQSGIRKINFFSGLLAAAMDRARRDAPGLGYDYLELKRRMGADWQAVVAEQIELFAGRAR